MEFTVEKQTIVTKEEIRCEMQEHSVDSELLLPDVFPDIGRILKCKGVPKIFSKQIGGGTLTLEGAVAVQLLYVTEEGKICFYHQNLPIYHEMAVSEEATCARVEAKMDYCNCRGVNVRKVELHGAVSLRVTTMAKVHLPLLTNATGAGVELLKTEEQVTTLLAVGEKNITLTDEFPIPSGSVRCILRSHGMIADGVCKPLADKGVVQGSLQICGLYENDQGGYETLRGEIPFSQIVDMEGMEEDADCVLHFSVNSLELRPKTGMDGECKHVMVTADVTIEVEGFKTITFPLVTDGYSTQMGLGLRRCGSSLKRLVQNQTIRCSWKKTLDLGREIGNVQDMWCEIGDRHTRVEGNTVILSGMITLCVLATDRDGVPMYLEKTADYSVEEKISGKEQAMDCQAKVEIEKFAYTLIGDASVELRADLKIPMVATETLLVSAVSELVADSAALPPAPCAPIVIYYAAQGERVFDIARRYNTTCKAILDANNISGSVLTEKKALLIPAVS